MTNQSHQDSIQDKISLDTSIIGPNLTIKGDISGSEDLIIQGKIQGNVHLKNYNIMRKKEVLQLISGLKTLP